MSESSAVEIDFFGLGGGGSSESSPKRLSDRRDIQGVISKINPELLKTAIASASGNNSFAATNRSSSSPSPPLLQTIPIYNPDPRVVNMATNAAPLTIIFNGTVSVFDVSPNQAENIMKLAESVKSGSENGVEPVLCLKPESKQNEGISRVLSSNDLPMSRKRSLRRFLEKRKERHVCTCPYAYSQGSSTS